MKVVTVLDYAKRPKRRILRCVTVIITLLALVGALVYLRATIKAFWVDRYEAWRFASTFDRIKGGLFPGDSALWTPHAGVEDGGKLLQEIGAATSSAAKQYLGDGRRVVLFARRGQTSGQEWMAFACISSTGPEVFSFNRGDRKSMGYDRLCETRQFWGRGRYKPGELSLNPGKVSTGDGRVVTPVRIDGGPNVLVWTISASPTLARRSNMAYASNLVIPDVIPRTGWISNKDWWPDTGDVVLLEGPSPVSEIPAVAGAMAITFMPDGRIGLLTPRQLAIASREDSAIEMMALPTLDRAEIGVFSPDGLSCYIGETSGDDFLVSTLDAKPIGLGGTAGRPRPFYLNDRTLIIKDNTGLRRVDCTTGKMTDEPAPAEYLRGFTRTGDISAYSAYEPTPDVVHVKGGVSKYTIPDIQGRHQMSLSPDGKWLVLKGQSGISIFDVKSGEVVWEHGMNHDLHTASSRIKWNRDGTIGAAAGNQYVYVWSMAAPRWAIRFPHGRQGNWPDIALSEDGKSIAASASGSASVAYWPTIGPATQPSK